MRTVTGLAAFSIAFLISLSPALAADCPAGSTNDDCDQWLFERADQTLSDMVKTKLAEQSRLTTKPDIAEKIHQTGRDAHLAWVAFRAKECEARATARVMSARTHRGLLASCRLSMTERRINELKSD